MRRPSDAADGAVSLLGKRSGPSRGSDTIFGTVPASAPRSLARLRQQPGDRRTTPRPRSLNGGLAGLSRGFETESRFSRPRQRRAETE